MNSTNPVPVITVSHPPQRAAEAWRFARRIRTCTETFPVTGVVLVSNHWIRPGESVTVDLKVDDTRQAAAGRALAEHLGELLRSAGLTPDLSARWVGDTMASKPIMEALSDTQVPLVQVSVPVRFGDDLMRLAAVALQDLRREGILFVGFSDVFGDALITEQGPFQYQSTEEGVSA